jgi:hypothetical protein
LQGKWWRIAHWLIIINFVLGITYGAYMFFLVVGGGPPLFQRAKYISPDVMLARRLYAIETWIITAGLTTYLALTEILPRRLSQVKDHLE